MRATPAHLRSPATPNNPPTPEVKEGCPAMCTACGWPCAAPTREVHPKVAPVARGDVIIFRVVVPGGAP